MKRTQLTIPSLFLFLLLFAAGCSSGTPPPSTPAQVNYVKGTSYVYLQYQLDTSDVEISSSADTITSKVISIDTTYQGKSNVTILANTHSNSNPPDTTYIAQESGNFWHYNYGLESVNTNQAVLSITGGKKLNSGWVLQAKLGANQGEKWSAAYTNVPIGSFNPLFTDTATEAQDFSLQVGNQPVVSKHSLHSILISQSGAGSASGTVDTYVSPSDGTTLNIVHSSTAVFLAKTTTVGGSKTILLSVN